MLPACVDSIATDGESIGPQEAGLGLKQGLASDQAVVCCLLYCARQASDVAVMQQEDQRLGMPRFVTIVKGLDFGQQFATQFASPLTGESAALVVLMLTNS